MAPTFKVCLQHSVIFWLALNMALLHFSSSVTVHVHYTSPKLTGKAIPDELNITVKGESGTPTYLHLKRAQYVSPNVPVCSLIADKNGKYECHQENLEDQKNIVYFQDLENEAVIEVTSTDETGEKGSLVVRGELSIQGQRYSLNADRRFKRDTSSPSLSEDIPYDLLPQAASLVYLHDNVEAPPEREKKIVETVKLDSPGLLSLLTLSNTSSNISSLSSIRSRRQSQTGQEICIDTVAVIDNAIYKRFQQNSGTRTATLQAIREYFAFIFTGVDLRYRGITSTIYPIRVKLIKLIVAETSEASMFTEQHRVGSSLWYEVDALKALTDFSNFAAGAGRDILIPNDHAMLFTGYDLTSRTSSGDVSDSTTGLAYTSTMCRSDGKSASIVEDRGGFQAVDTATHELGHSLSAPHDGEGNVCLASARYIMSPGGYPANEDNKLHAWLFSSCSITSFTDFIANKIRSESGRNCLLQQLSVREGVSDVSNRLPGQEFPADDQCRMIYGNASRMCRGTEFGSISDICTSMFCFDPSTSGTCFGHKAAMGTTCGSGKLCLNGQCVRDSRAPTVNDDCVLGDQPGIAFNGKTCPQLVNSFTGYCYQAAVRSRCCASCQKVYRSVSDCQYGDTVRGCSSNICPHITADSLKQCCGTCNYGTPLASSQSRVTAAAQIRTLVNSSRPPTQQVRSTPATVPTTDSSSSSCSDSTNVLINGLGCSAVVRQRRSLCSNQTVRRLCCLSCRLMNSRIVRA